MIINAIALALLDVPVDMREPYNRWYDLDHLPEHLAKPDVVTAARYVAAEAVSDPAIVGELGHPPFATIYSFGGPTDFMSDAALTGWSELDRSLTKSGRFWKDVEVTHASRWRLVSAVARRSIPVSAEAIPHLAHSGVVMCFGRHPNGGRDEARQWWSRTQQDELIDLPGVVAILGFEPADESDTLLHLLLCADDSGDVLNDFLRVRELHRHLGRYPAFRGEYEAVTTLPYRRLAPLGFESAPVR
jgi:hypothetical protein